MGKSWDIPLFQPSTLIQLQTIIGSFFFDFVVYLPTSLVHTYTSYVTQIHFYTCGIDPHMH